MVSLLGLYERRDITLDFISLSLSLPFNLSEKNGKDCKTEPFDKRKHRHVSREPISFQRLRFPCFGHRTRRVPSSIPPSFFCMLGVDPCRETKRSFKEAKSSRFVREGSKVRRSKGKVRSPRRILLRFPCNASSLREASFSRDRQRERAFESTKRKGRIDFFFFEHRFFVLQKTQEKILSRVGDLGVWLRGWVYLVDANWTQGEGNPGRDIFFLVVGVRLIGVRCVAWNEDLTRLERRHGHDRVPVRFRIDLDPLLLRLDVD